jgi:uncharacterized protein
VSASGALEELQTLEVVLTARCNLRCTYCYQNDKKARRMEWETLRGALDLFLRSRRRDLTIIFLGGEPLLEFPLLERTVEHLRPERRRGKRIECELITNGTLLDDATLDFLVRHRFAVQLSFDGVEAAQLLRGPQTFAILDGLLDRLRRDRPRFYRERLRIAFTLSAATVPHLADSVSYFLKKGVSHLVVSPLATHEPAWRLEDIRLLEEQMERVFRASLRHYRRTGEVPLTLFRKGTEDHHSPRRDALCGAPSGKSLAVDVDGAVHGCAIFVESYQKFPTPMLRETVDRIRLGDYRAAGFEARLEAYPGAARGTGLFHGKERKRSSYGACADCRFLADCSICPGSIAHIPGNADPDRIPDFPCAWNLVALAAAERFPAQPDPIAILMGTARAYGPAGRAQRQLLGAIRATRSAGPGD